MSTQLARVNCRSLLQSHQARAFPLQNLIQAADGPDDVRITRFLFHAIEYLPIRAPDSGFCAINHAGAETGGKNANGIEASSAKLDAFYLRLLCKCRRAQHNQRSRNGHTPHDSTLGYVLHVGGARMSVIQWVDERARR